MTTSSVRSFDDGNRAIGFALLISLALHLALLVMLPSIREALQRRSEAADPILARIVEPPAKRVAEAAPAPPPVEAIEPVAPAATVPKPPSQAAATRIKPPRATSETPVATEAPATSAPVPARTEPVQAETAVPVSPASSAGVVAAAPQPAPPASVGVDAGTLAQYRLAIMSAARQFKRYPRVARDQNWQGRVEIRLAIAPSGEISALSVRSSTGYELLDQHALEMIERAKALAQIPPALRGREFSVDIPVVFSLREAGG
jgi:periplasmic protein TonB